MWATALRESHDSVYAYHLRVPQTLARISINYWWPDMGVHVRRWVQSCRDCGSRKAKAKEVIPPLRSQGVGGPGDRWAIDVAGSLPVTPEGNRYVIAAVDALRSSSSDAGTYRERRREIYEGEIGIRANERSSNGWNTRVERTDRGGIGE
ncbi:unnamed protein product [Phytophthora fragariaefolia]|uniref:Unnamed protein product n=1 Tax=Phytophthora fragariaefolia TaxID=1490495 RepID=A0A9W6YBY0_9STRA|nr:unnamed protein product [Phytophthora fragariaefolia]